MPFLDILHVEELRDCHHWTFSFFKIFSFFNLNKQRTSSLYDLGSLHRVDMYRISSGSQKDPLQGQSLLVY